MWDYTLHHNGQELYYGYSAAEYKTDVLTGFAVNFIRSISGLAPTSLPEPLVHGPHNEQGTDSHKVTYNTAPRPAPRHTGAFSTEPLPIDPSFNEADVSDKPAWVRSQPLMGKSKVASVTKRYQTQLASLLAVDEGVSQVITALGDAAEQHDLHLQQ